MNTSWPTPRCWFAVLAAGSLAVWSPSVVAQQPSQFRSVTDVRPRIPDEHDRPYFRETQSHRGWEIRDPQFTVLAETSAADARWAAGQVTTAWQRAAVLADRWTDAHHNPDFGLSSLQVVISGESPRDRDGPLTTVNVVGIQTQIQINVSPGQPSLQDQSSRIREAAAFGMLHAVGLDSAAPPWVVAGLAASAGRDGQSREESQPNPAVDRAARFGGQQWRYQRAAEDRLAAAPHNHEEDATRVAFLLTGDDATHAPAFIGLLRLATAGAQRAAVNGSAFQSFPGDAQLPTDKTEFDSLFGDLREQYANWQSNPNAGQPAFAPKAGEKPEFVAAQQEMLVLLKLQRRLVSTDRPQTAATKTVGRGAIRTKIITFPAGRGPATSEQQFRTAAPMSFDQLAAHLRDPAEPTWATLDVDGSLLLSTDTSRVTELLANANRRYSLEHADGRNALVRRLDSGDKLRGWLEDNAKDKTRPLAKFEIIAPAMKTKAVTTEPAKQANRFPAKPTAR